MIQTSSRLPVVGVMGSGTHEHTDLADQVGELLANLGVHLLTGGGQGVMLSVSRAFARTTCREGMIIGILPCMAEDRPCDPKSGYPNPFVEIVIATHLPLSGARGTESMSRNHINVLSSDAIVALPGGAGTAAETRLAHEYEKPIVAFLDERSTIPHLDQSIPVVRTRREVETFLRCCLADRLRRG